MELKFNPDDIKVIIGLGNPGNEHKDAYHNVGAQAISYIRNNVGEKLANKYKLLVLWEYSPKTPVYMNEAGALVQKVMRKLGCKPDEVMIIHDDSDITLGEMKISFGRGSAGHKGIGSIIEALGTNEFWRTRIGIRKETTKKRKKAGEFVLSKITVADRKLLERQFQELANTLTAYI